MVLGFVVGPLVKLIGVGYSRWRARSATDKYVGTWDAFNYLGRETVAMKGAGATTITAAPWWKLRDPYVLDVTASDLTESGSRNHMGKLAIDPNAPKTGKRTLEYDKDAEATVQQVQISEDGQRLIITADDGAGYSRKHELKKRSKYWEPLRRNGLFSSMPVGQIPPFRRRDIGASWLVPN